MDAKLYQQFKTASLEAARKGTRVQTLSPQDIEDLAAGLLGAWGEAYGYEAVPSSSELLEFGRAQGIFAEERKQREAAASREEVDWARMEVVRPQETDPATRCDPIPDSNRLLSRLRKGNSSEKMYYTLWRLHEGKRMFQGQPQQLSRRVRYQVLPNLPPEWCTDAQRDLLTHHIYKSKGSPCPTCKRIAGFIRGVGQKEVERTVSSLVVLLRMGEEV